MATQLLSDLASAWADLQAVEREVTDLGAPGARAGAASRRTGASVTAAERQVRDHPGARRATRPGAACTRFDGLHQQFVALPPADRRISLRPPQATRRPSGPTSPSSFPVRIETRFQGGSGRPTSSSAFPTTHTTPTSRSDRRRGDVRPPLREATC
jgi:hypothetical protein